MEKQASSSPTSTASIWPLLLWVGAVIVPGASRAQTGPDTGMGFFITSQGSGKGADLGGLAGADEHCRKLADAVGAGKRTWRAYLSTQAAGGQVAVNARDRIGKGPWYNAKGVRVAQDVAELHSESNKLGKENSLTEKGEVVKGRGNTPNQHDMLTGSLQDGTAFPPGADRTCRNWTSADSGSAQLGHHDRQGGGENPTSWNSAHVSRACSLDSLVRTGGNGYFYCFAFDGAGTGLREDGRGMDRLAGVALLNGPAGSGPGEIAYRFELPQRRDIAVDVHDFRGGKAATLLRGTLTAGSHAVRWNGRDDRGRPLPRGLYFIRLAVR